MSGMDPTRFLLMFAGRTGSTFMMDILAKQPAVKAGMEELVWYRHRHAEEPEVAAREQRAFAERFYATEIPEGCRAVGFKTKLYDIVDRDDFAPLLRDLGVRLIRMRRRNVLKLAISAMNAKRVHEKTGRWNIWSDADRPDAITIDVEELMARIRRRDVTEERIGAFCEQFETEPLEIWYEDLLADVRATLERVGSFLGFELTQDAQERSEVRKVTSDDLRDAIANFDEVEKALEGTDYQRLLYADSADAGSTAGKG